MPASKNDLLTIGDAARRAGVATSTLRFYESRGLIHSIRTSGNQRRYHRSTLRRISLIRVAQGLGVSLGEIANALSTLPSGKAPTKRDWESLSRNWQDQLDARIEQLQNVRSKLTECIGCGCLSLKNCALYNAGDHAAGRGVGPRYLLGDSPDLNNHQ